MQKKQRAAELTREDWKALTAWISVVCDLDQKKFRDEAAELAVVLEAEGYAAHRSADVLEDLSIFKSAARDVQPSLHSRSAILKKLKHWNNDRHLRLVEGRLDQLVEVGLREKLRQQAAVLLDAAELIRTTLQWHQQRLDTLWPLKVGRTPSVARNEVLLKMLEWKVGPTEMFERLREGGIREKRFKLRPLTAALSRHRARSRKKK